MNIQDLEEKYGIVEWNDKEYILTDQAEFTGRVLTEYGNKERNNFFEMSANALDRKLNEYVVYWIFELKYRSDGEEYDLEDYNYNEVDRVVLIEDKGNYMCWRCHEVGKQGFYEITDIDGNLVVLCKDCKDDNIECRLL